MLHLVDRIRPFSTGLVSTASRAVIATTIAVTTAAGFGTGGSELPTPTRYVSKAATSSDGNNGLTPETAWLTIGKVNSELSGLSGSDIIGFRAGDVFDDTTLIINRSGTSGAAPLQFVKYGAGADPVISGGTVLTGWSLDSGIRWFTSYSGSTPSHLVRDGENSFPDQESSNSAVDADREWRYDSGANRIYFASTVDPNTVPMEAGTDEPIHIQSSAQFIRLRNIHARVSNDMGIDITGGSDIELWDTRAQNALFSGVAVRSNADNVTVERGRYHHNGKFRGTTPNSGNVGHGILVEGIGTNGPVIVDGAELDNNSEDGVQYNDSGAQTAGTGHIVRNCNIHDNVENGIDNKGAHDVLWEDNLIVDHGAEGLDVIGYAGKTRMYRNIVLRSGTAGIALGNGNTSQALAQGNYDHEIIGNVVGFTGLRTGFGPLMQFWEFGTGTSGDKSTAKVYNNVFYSTTSGQYGFYLRGIGTNAEVDLRNNITESNGPALRLDSGVDFSDLSFEQNNLLRRNFGNTNPVIQESGGSSYTHAQITSGAYTTAEGKGQNTITGNPAFKDVNNDDFRITTGSIAEDAGQAIAGVTVDINGDAWGDPPHMGAYAIAVAP